MGTFFVRIKLDIEIHCVTKCYSRPYTVCSYNRSETVHFKDALLTSRCNGRSVLLHYMISKRR